MGNDKRNQNKNALETIVTVIKMNRQALNVAQLNKNEILQLTLHRG